MYPKIKYILNVNNKKEDSSARCVWSWTENSINYISMPKANGRIANITLGRLTIARYSFSFPIRNWAANRISCGKWLLLGDRDQQRVSIVICSFSFLFKKQKMNCSVTRLRSQQVTWCNMYFYFSSDLRSIILKYIFFFRSLVTESDNEIRARLPNPVTRPVLVMGSGGLQLPSSAVVHPVFIG